jgi:hypothetical protein
VVALSGWSMMKCFIHTLDTLDTLDTWHKSNCVPHVLTCVF